MNKEELMDASMKELEELFEKMGLLSVSEVVTPNLFSVAGPGHNENRLSDLMALFMGSHPGAPRWLGKALITCLFRRGAFGTGVDSEFLEGIDWNDIVADREVGAWDVVGETTKRLDLVLRGNDFIVGVEHKVWASASYNPFSIYDNLLVSYGLGKQAKCVLRPNDCRKHVPDDWIVVSYNELVDTAYELFGSEAAKGVYDKWQAFYLELLKHMESIASPEEVKTMGKKELEFSLKYFSQLYEAKNYLARLEGEFIQEGKSKISAALGVSESEVNVKATTWDDSRVLRFYIQRWEGDTQVCLIYYPETEESEADETVGFYVRSYVDREGGSKDLEKVEVEFLSSVPVDKCDDLTFYRDGGEKDSWYENNKRYLALDAWPREYTKLGAMAALAGLAKWIDERVNEQSQTTVLADNH